MKRLLALLSICFMLFVFTKPLFASTTRAEEQRHSLIAFISTRQDGWYEIYVMDSNGQNIRKLTTGWHVVRTRMSWSPDGNKIAFTSDRDGNNEVYVMNADGSNQVNLSRNAADDLGPAWSPDGSKIAFTSVRDGNAQIYVMKADGSNQVNLSRNAADDSEPAWSPDGNKIVYNSLRNDNLQIYVMNADGSDQVNLSQNSSEDYSPVWSPDGSKIAFTSERDLKRQIYVMNADGSHQLNLTKLRAKESAPSWSPDGSKVVYQAGGNPQIYVMNADGNNPFKLINTNDVKSANVQNVTDMLPVWSPWLPGAGEPEATATPSVPTATAIPVTTTPSELACSNAPPSRLNVGMTAFVAIPDPGQPRRNLRVRAKPGGEQVGSLTSGQYFIITGEAVCGEDGLRWWPIATRDGSLKGWSVEALAVDDTIMTPEW